MGVEQGDVYQKAQTVGNGAWAEGRILWLGAGEHRSEATSFGFVFSSHLHFLCRTSPALSPCSNSDPGSHSGRSSPLPGTSRTTVVANDSSAWFFTPGSFCFICRAVSSWLSSRCATPWGWGINIVLWLPYSSLV